MERKLNEQAEIKNTVPTVQGKISEKEMQTLWLQKGHGVDIYEAEKPLISKVSKVKTTKGIYFYAQQIKNIHIYSKRFYKKM